MRKYLFALWIWGSLPDAFAQANLPSFWDMGNILAPPTGWSYDLSIGSGTNLTYTTSPYYFSPSQSMRLDNTGEYLKIKYKGRADTISYYLRHTGTSNPFSGVFDLQESADGNSWSTVYSYKNNMPNTVTRQIFRLHSYSRYVRFYYAQKNSGYNVALDDVNILPAGPGPNPEIQIRSNGIAVNNGQKLRPGNAAAVDLIIKNNSLLQTLDIDSIAWVGADASYFNLIGIADSIVAGKADTATIVISIAPPGSIFGTLQIFSNDSSGNGLFEIPVYAISGDRASEPLTSAANLQFIENKAWRIKVNVENNGAENVLVLVKPNTAITDAPKDGSVYSRGSYIGSSRVMWSGPAEEIILDKIYANTPYFIQVFSYNGYDSYVNYKTSGYVAIDTVTPGLQPKTYYSGISVSDTFFVTNLRSRIRPHSQIFYSNYGSTMVENFEAYDTSDGKRVLHCYYSGYQLVYTPPITWDTMSREHSYPYSWMGETNQDSANYSDLHVLFPVHQRKANLVRSNFPLNNLKSVTYTFLEGKLGIDSNGKVAYEPMDAAKGVVSRACFYLCAAYNRPGKPFTIPTSVPLINEKQDQAVLKRWNQQFPPSNREIARHEYVAQTQGNRNPFIDNPGWACYIDFSDMSHIPTGNCFPANHITAPKPDLIRSILAYPNPSKNIVTLDLSAFQSQTGTLEVYDFSEKLVFSKPFFSASETIDLSRLQAGTYLLMVKGKSEIGFYTLLRN